MCRLVAMACVAEIPLHHLLGQPECPRMHRRLTSSWDVLTSVQKDGSGASAVFGNHPSFETLKRGEICCVVSSVSNCLSVRWHCNCTNTDWRIDNESVIPNSLWPYLWIQTTYCSGLISGFHIPLCGSVQAA